MGAEGGKAHAGPRPGGDDAGDAIGDRVASTSGLSWNRRSDGFVPIKFDRERVVLYVAAVGALVIVASFYIGGYLLPTLSFAEAIVNAARNDRGYPTGCYLLFMEHANRMLSLYAIRFLGMIIGIAVAFVGMVFTIKGLEAGYSLDIHSGSSSASMKTASPGLVLCTLGLALVAVSVLHKSILTFQQLPACLQ